jgi:AraC-like DNA-binding protein
MLSYSASQMKSDIELPFVTYNAHLLATVAPQLEAELTEQLAQKTFSEQAKGILKHLLAGQRPGIQDLARELHLSTRTLQRRLTEQGITFQHLLDEARRELARHYLLHSSRELNETAYLLEATKTPIRSSGLSTTGKGLHPATGGHSKRLAGDSSSPSGHRVRKANVKEG